MTDQPSLEAFYKWMREKGMQPSFITKDNMSKYYQQYLRDRLYDKD